MRTIYIVLVGLALVCLVQAGRIAFFHSSPSVLHSYKDDEIDADTYRVIQSDTESDPVLKQRVKRFMADGKINYGELEQINAYQKQKLEAAIPVAAIKRQLANGE